MKDKRQRLQSIVWPYNVAAAAVAAAAAAADQSGLYAYMMQSTALASLLHSQYARLMPLPVSAAAPSGRGSSAVALAAGAGSPLSYVAGTPLPASAAPASAAPLTDHRAMTWDDPGVCGRLASLAAAARHAAAAAETSPTTRSLFRPYQSLSVGVESD